MRHLGDVRLPIGIPIGIAAATGERLWRIVRVIIDTLQTCRPSSI
jgi:ABC-type proline/glycine betaine transport system permease subunit